MSRPHCYFIENGLHMPFKLPLKFHVKTGIVHKSVQITVRKWADQVVM